VTGWGVEQRAVRLHLIFLYNRPKAIQTTHAQYSKQEFQRSVDEKRSSLVYYWLSRSTVSVKLHLQNMISLPTDQEVAMPVLRQEFEYY
jgi:hypothetical protein